MNEQRYFIAPELDKLRSALNAWLWLGLEGKTPIRVTAFADVFFSAPDGVWFLDTLEGKLERVCTSVHDLDQIVATEEARDRYLLAGLVDRAISEGMTLEAGQCYDFRINPVLGGAVAFENVEAQDFLVALHIAGQIHEQVRNLPPGTKINAVTIDENASERRKRWWRWW